MLEPLAAFPGAICNNRVAIGEREVRRGGAAPTIRLCVRLEAEDEDGFVAALRGRDESAFVTLVDRYHSMMVRLARLFVHDAAVAEEVVQETWLGVLRSLDRFESRSSLKRWISVIVINHAKARALRERRSVPFSLLWDAAHEEALAPAAAGPDERVLSQETNRHVLACIDDLPEAQRRVLVLRDVHGWSADETCRVLQISEVNQRVLLYRGRSKLRRALNVYLAGP